MDKEKLFQVTDENFDNIKLRAMSIHDEIDKANADSKEVIMELLSKVGKLSFEELPTCFNAKYHAFNDSLQAAILSVYYDDGLKNIMVDTEEIKFEKLDNLQNINGGLFTYELLRFIINYKELMI